MAAFNAVDAFNYTDGDLTGNNGGSGFGAAWSGSILYDVESTVYPDGAVTQKGVQVALFATEPGISRLMSASADSGDMYYSCRRDSSTDQTCYLGMFSGASLGFYVPMVVGGDLQLIGTTTQTLVSGMTLGSWYDVHVQWTSSSTVKARVKLSTSSVWGSFSSAVTLLGSLTSVDTVQFQVSASGAGVPTIYFGRIQPTDFTVASTASANRNFALLGVGT